jgi:hypothetical protein
VGLLFAGAGECGSASLDHCRTFPWSASAVRPAIVSGKTRLSGQLKLIIEIATSSGLSSPVRHLVFV